MKKVYRFLILATFCASFFFAGCKLSEEHAFRFYDNAEAYTPGSFTGESATVQQVEIDWYGGTVEIEKSSSEKVFVFEEESELSEEKSLYTYLDEGVLRVKYCQSGFCGKIDETQKNLQVEIPKDVGIKINGVNVNVYLGVLDVKSLDVKTEKGCVEGESIVCQRAEIETDSGYIGIGALTAEQIEIDSDSGDVHVGLPNCREGKIETENGNVTLYLQGDVCALIKFESERGKLLTDRYYEEKEGVYFFKQEREEMLNETSSIPLLVKTEKGNLRVQ